MTTSFENLNSIFDKDTFHDFTRNKLQKLFLNKESMDDLLKMREEALVNSHKTQSEFIKAMFENNRVSPKTY